VILSIRELQQVVNERWSKQIGNPCHQSADANHALVHMTKALGKMASALNDASHEEREPTAEEVEKALADLIICASRFAHGIVDLEDACKRRLAEKFPVKTPADLSQKRRAAPE
jgi:hypothetical protein